MSAALHVQPTCTPWVSVERRCSPRQQSTVGTSQSQSEIFVKLRKQWEIKRRRKGKVRRSFASVRHPHATCPDCASVSVSMFRQKSSPQELPETCSCRILWNSLIWFVKRPPCLSLAQFHERPFPLQDTFCTMAPASSRGGRVLAWLS